MGIQQDPRFFCVKIPSPAPEPPVRASQAHHCLFSFDLAFEWEMGRLGQVGFFDRFILECLSRGLPPLSRHGHHHRAPNGSARFHFSRHLPASHGKLPFLDHCCFGSFHVKQLIVCHHAPQETDGIHGFSPGFVSIAPQLQALPGVFYGIRSFQKAFLFFTKKL
jgi:hypothetical protein